MNLLIGVVAIVAISYLTRFLLALRREEKRSAGREITVYVVEPGRSGIRKIPARSYGRFAVMDGGAPRGNPTPAAAAPANVLEYRRDVRRDALSG